MKIVFGTTNAAKLLAMKAALAALDVEIVGANELGAKLPDVAEDGKTPLENAQKKAAAYFAALRVPVFSCDSGLYFDGVDERDQPGLNVRSVGGRRLDDAEMLAHYSALAKKYGRITARYRNAISFVADESHVFDAMWKSMESESFYIVAEPHKTVNPGFPLDSLSVDIASGKYFYDLGGEKLKNIDTQTCWPEFFAYALGELRGLR